MATKETEVRPGWIEGRIFKRSLGVTKSTKADQSSNSGRLQRSPQRMSRLQSPKGFTDPGQSRRESPQTNLDLRAKDQKKPTPFARETLPPGSDRAIGFGVPASQDQRPKSLKQRLFGKGSV